MIIKLGVPSSAPSACPTRSATSFRRLLKACSLSSYSFSKSFTSLHTTTCRTDNTTTCWQLLCSMSTHTENQPRGLKVLLHGEWLWKSLVHEEGTWKSVHMWSTDLLSFYNTKQKDRPQNKWWNKHISGLFICFVRTVRPHPFKGKSFLSSFFGIFLSKIFF